MEIREAIILMAGSGSRLRIARANILKPLVPIHGRPLVSYIIDALVGAGVKKIIAVVGFENELLIDEVSPLVPAGIEIRFVYNSDWQKQNGVSVLAAASEVTGPFILGMSDHLFERKILDVLLSEADPARTNLAVDRKLQTIFDLEDAMKISSRENEIVAIGKKLPRYDGIDTGLFVCSADLFDYLRRAMKNGDCSLADGIQLMANDRRVRAIDIGDAWWQDIDTPEMLVEAEIRTKSWGRRPHFASAAHTPAL
jgi:choline kinase